MLLYTPPRVQREIPLVDLAPSFSASREDRRSVADEIHKAARQSGFFYVANHGIAAEVVDGAFRQTRRFFSLPLTDKLALSQTPGKSHGYEQLRGQRLDDGSPPDLKEGFTIAGEVTPERAGDGLPEHAPTLWPALEGFREPILAYYTAACTLGERLMRLLALSLDMPEEFFEACFAASNPSMRMHRYPPQPDDAAFNQLGAGAHTDWGAITVLAQDQNGGLEVENAAGEWLSATHIPETFVINLGDMMARWTNDLYHSNMHRVMNGISGTDRYSIALFYNPVYFTQVECLPTCVTAERPAAYPPCTAGEHINQKRMLAAKV